MEKNMNVNGSEEIAINDVAFVMTRLSGFVRILGELGFECRIQMDGMGMPYALSKKNDQILRYVYTMVDDDGDSFVLEVSAILELEHTGDTGVGFDSAADLACHHFNSGSPFGYAVYLPEEHLVEFKHQALETGVLQDTKYYDRLIGLFMQGFAEFADSLPG